MREQFVTYELALELKELGFDEKCFMIYYDGTDELRGESHFLYYRNIKAPLWQQAFDFILKKLSYTYLLICQDFKGYTLKESKGNIEYYILTYSTQEQILKELIKILKNEKQIS